MARYFEEATLLIGSQNTGKVKEFRELLKERAIALQSLKDFNLPEPEETGTTFLENAILKAQYYSKLTNLPTLADDSGIQIAALNNGPGVQSKRFIEEQGGRDKSFMKLEQLLEGKDKSASMHCALVLMWPDGYFESAEGVIEGTITFPPRGEGFGADPIFIPKGYTETFGENPELKYRISHRTQALKKLYELCFQ